MKQKIAICFGTRPEIIKLFPLSQKMGSKFEVINVFTGQHHSLFKDVKHLIPKIHYFLPIGEYSHLSLLYSDLIKQLYIVLNEIKPDMVVVQGDTASAYCASFCAFTMGIKVGHVEAGLRTYDLKSPFPEEFNRQAISKMAHYNWCPSELAANNLKNEKVSGKIIITGNTIVDAIQSISKHEKCINGDDIVITLHRRENKANFENILSQISTLSEQYYYLNFIFPAHPNPIIQEKLVNLKDNVQVVKPLKYENFISLLKKCRGIISDSGGVQEEAACLRKKVIVCRDNTERPEAVNVGISRVVGTDVVNNFMWLITPLEGRFDNPYGDGNACDLIIRSIK